MKDFKAVRKALIIGGSGTISASVVKRLKESGEWEVWVLNRGNHPEQLSEGVHLLQGNIQDEKAVEALTDGMEFDTVCEFTGFHREDAERDVRLFRGRTRQYMFISSASAYHKPVREYRITEGTSLANPYWQYSRDKIACENYLMEQYRETGFPVTIVRPSHTYDWRKIPLGVHGSHGNWQVVKRMLEEKPVIIQGDGSSLWTLTHASDFAIGFTGLMGNPHALGEAFQITGDESLTWNQIYEEIAAAAGVTLKPYHVASDFLAEAGKPWGYDFTGELLGDKAATVVFDNTKLKRLVPEMGTHVPFAQGVRQALQYILAHPEYQLQDPEFDRWCDRVIQAQERAKQTMLPDPQ